MIVHCPWHDEETPSCHVDWKRERVHCFGCGRISDLATWKTALIDSWRDRSKRKPGRYIELLASREWRAFGDRQTASQLRSAADEIDNARLNEASRHFAGED